MTDYLEKVSIAHKNSPLISNFREKLLDFNGFLFKSAVSNNINTEDLKEEYKKLSNEFNLLIWSLEKGEK